MANATISAVEFDLAQYKYYDPNSTEPRIRDRYVEGKPFKGYYYTVAGVKNADGKLRPLSMAELVMVICLARAAEKEAAVIELMETMSSNTTILEALTEVEQKIVNDFASIGYTEHYTLSAHSIQNGPYAGVDFRTFLHSQGVIDDKAKWVYWDNLPNPGQDIKYDDLIAEIEAKMDSLNSFSQQKMIELQSETNKRDQSYDMITNILKSLNTVQVGIVNNM